MSSPDGSRLEEVKLGWRDGRLERRRGGDR